MFCKFYGVQLISPLNIGFWYGQKLTCFAKKKFFKKSRARAHIKTNKKIYNKDIIKGKFGGAPRGA